MDLHPTPFPGKVLPVKSRFNKNISRAPKTQPKESSIPRQNRVFGTVRNPNVPTKTVSKKSVAKASSGVPQKPWKSPTQTQSLTDSATNPVIETAKNSTEEKRVRPSKKSVCFQENRDAVEPQTPVQKSANLVKPRLSGSTPFYSAVNCSKCRFDMLETSSYWLSQIKLAETVGKHFVSAAFFRLALESKAEPFRNIMLELKRYLRRHKHLSEGKEWKEVCFSYGLILKDEGSSGAVIASNNKGNDLECTIEKEEEESKDLNQEVTEDGVTQLGNELPLPL
ncbi:PREDICTED: uncharacterized protein LOC109243907 [Nicotiana attenuata]|uniref:Uncharacterized protein n=1 Tax=Nicotiana attenuata TaxID=49451 RepID=A0A314L0M3_NICAT|nr:PREDICTED: uncharacterized protein LOC109243907 [Nicotiana attenuata]OIT35032.1 hypothetical protein A4A49_05883 [Nicotiana attenuata]